MSSHSLPLPSSQQQQQFGGGQPLSPTGQHPLNPGTGTQPGAPSGILPHTTPQPLGGQPAGTGPGPGLNTPFTPTMANQGIQPGSLGAQPIGAQYPLHPGMGGEMSSIAATRRPGETATPAPMPPSKPGQPPQMPPNPLQQFQQGKGGPLMQAYPQIGQMLQGFAPYFQQQSPLGR